MVQQKPGYGDEEHAHCHEQTQEFEMTEAVHMDFAPDLHLRAFTGPKVNTDLGADLFLIFPVSIAYFWAVLKFLSQIS